MKLADFLNSQLAALLPTLYNPPMHLWSLPEGVVTSSGSPLHWQLPSMLVISSLVLSTFLLLQYAGAMDETMVPIQRSKNTSPYVGSAMAVLATLQQADVLPPEGSREADRVIQSVIQIQSAFAKGTDRSLQDFARRALAEQYGEEAATVLERFRISGWTADLLQALSDAELKASAEERQGLAMGLEQFNLSVHDFTRFMQLIRDGRSALSARGLNFTEVYAHHRNTMPGSGAR